HVQLHALTYERLELTDQSGPVGEGDARAAQLWVGLARAALATAPDDTRPTPTEPAVIAQAIDQHSKAEATGYDQVIVGYLLQIAAELKTAGSAEAAALRRMARAAPAGAAPRTDHHLTEPDRLVAMALEIGTMGPRLHAAVDRVVAEGRLAQLLDALEAGVADTAAAATVRARIATAA